MQSENFERQLLQTGKWAALVAIVLTSICTIAVLGLQLALVVAGVGWTSLSVGEVLESAGEPPRLYETASGEQPISFHAAPVLEWVLDLPAMLLLVSILGLLAVFYAYIKSLEKMLPRP
jgi:hypothetical protein